MKIIVTGSHFTPAQAVIEELKQNPNIEISYIGRKHTREGDSSPSIESQVLPKLGVKFIPLITGRLQRSFTVYTIPSLFKIPLGFLQAFYYLVKEKPDVVLSFGGYISVPVVISAWLLSIPVILHEQTLVSSLSNQISSHFADKIAVSFPENEFAKKRKIVLTGNPIRKEILEDNKNISADFKKILEQSQKDKLPIILITGGNQGSHIINQTVSVIVEELTKIASVIHQTGDSKFKDFEKLSEQKNGLKNPQRYFVEKWIEGKNFGVLLRSVDLVVSRAGANTLLELAYFGIPTLAIPIPYLYKNEQMVNSKYFEKFGLTKILPQKDLTKESLLENIEKMLRDLNNLKEKAKKAKSLVIPDAAKRLALETILLARKSI